MHIVQSSLQGVYVIEPGRYSDKRGYFSETYSRKAFAEFDLNLDFVQDNHSYSRERGTLRGLHFQSGPYAQDKLVRVVRGCIQDIAVDIRPNSPNFKKWFSIDLSRDNGLQLLIPKGFAHGFLTTEPETEVIYKVTQTYAPEFECGIIWSDPELAIQWNLDQRLPILSEKDQALPRLNDILHANCIHAGA